MPDLQVARVMKRIKDRLASSNSPKCDLGDTARAVAYDLGRKRARMADRYVEPDS